MSDLTEAVLETLIEKAARMIALHEYTVEIQAWIQACTCGWKADREYDTHAYDRHVARAVLEAVADDVRAEALRDAAEHILNELDAARTARGTTKEERLMTDLYRKKPVVIEARQLIGNTAAWHAVYQWVEANTLGSFEPLDVIEGRKPYPESGVSIDPRDGRLIISTLEGLHWADPSDWIIRGVQGEFYPVKDSIFRETYEAVADDE